MLRSAHLLGTAPGCPKRTSHSQRRTKPAPKPNTRSTRYRLESERRSIRSTLTTHPSTRVDRRGIESTVTALRRHAGQRLNNRDGERQRGVE